MEWRLRFSRRRTSLGDDAGSCPSEFESRKGKQWVQVAASRGHGSLSSMVGEFPEPGYSVGALLCRGVPLAFVAMMAGACSGKIEDSACTESGEAGRAPVVVSIAVTTFDEAGNPLSTTQDDDADGNIDSWTTRTFNEAGQQLTERVEGKLLETEGQFAFMEVTRDDSGRVVSVRTYDAAGEMVSENTKTFDEEGRVLSEDALHDPELGYTDRHLRYSYSDDGLVVTREDDSDSDGVADFRQIFINDEKGRWTELRLDYGANGEVDLIETRILDDAGRELRVETDKDADGITDAISVSTYNEAGQIVRREYDGDADGVADDVAVSVYDESGRRLRYEVDSDGDGIIDSVWASSYDAAGNEVSSSVAHRTEGLMNADFSSYNDEGQIVMKEWDNDGDGVVDGRRIYLYDSEGLLLSWESSAFETTEDCP